MEDARARFLIVFTNREMGIRLIESRRTLPMEAFHSSASACQEIAA